MTINVETVRDALVTLLDAALTGVGNPAQLVVGYKPSSKDVTAQSPLVAVMSAGIERRRLTFEGIRATVHLEIQVWVLYTDGSTWTPALAEDRLNLIEKTIAQVVEDNPSATNWIALDYEGQTSIRDFAFDGVPYVRETIFVAAECAQ